MSTRADSFETTRNYLRSFPRKKVYPGGGKQICRNLLRFVDQPEHGDRNILDDFSTRRIIKHASRRKSRSNDAARNETIEKRKRENTGRSYSPTGN